MKNRPHAHLVERELESCSSFDFLFPSLVAPGTRLSLPVLGNGEDEISPPPVLPTPCWLSAASAFPANTGFCHEFTRITLGGDWRDMHRSNALAVRPTVLQCERQRDLSVMEFI